MTKELKPCPMCGGVAFITTGSIVELWQQKVMCCECGLNIVRGGVSPSHAKERAVEAWNRREPIDKIVEQLEKYKELECDDIDEDIDEAVEDAEELYDIGRSQGRLEAYLNAIEIVKGGAV